MGEIVPEADNGILRRRLVNQDNKHNDSDPKPTPVAKWTFNREGVPQAVAHRGYKASYPENTMGAFRGAVEVGAHAIETDLHLSKDGVVVISHDADLKRCFGQPEKIRDCTWNYLSTVRTVHVPPSPMPRLADVLEYLAEPGMEDIWLLLDIKVDDRAEDLISRIAEIIAAAGGMSDWTKRIVLGCWTAKHMRLCHELLPGFAMAYIGIRLELAREFMKAVPNISMNMRQEPLFGIGGPRFIRDCREQGRPLYTWTVNQVCWMRWAIKTEMDCVITDDPKLYLEVAKPHYSNRLAQKQKPKPTTATRSGGGGVLATVWDTSFYYLVPLLVRFHTLWFGHYEKVGSPAKNREELQRWCPV